LQLWEHFKPRLKRSGQDKIFFEIETPLLPVLVAIENEGITLNAETLQEIGGEFKSHIAALEARLYTAA
ncbi:MAG: hypothetical protein ACPGC0_03330, partial [Opitutales bacterium]